MYQRHFINQSIESAWFRATFHLVTKWSRKVNGLPRRIWQCLLLATKVRLSSLLDPKPFGSPEVLIVQKCKFMIEMWRIMRLISTRTKDIKIHDKNDFTTTWIQPCAKFFHSNHCHIVLFWVNRLLSWIKLK